jgi:hypothetical protein
MRGGIGRPRRLALQAGDFLADQGPERLLAQPGLLHDERAAADEELLAARGERRQRQRLRIAAGLLGCDDAEGGAAPKRHLRFGTELVRPGGRILGGERRASDRQQQETEAADHSRSIAERSASGNRGIARG